MRLSRKCSSLVSVKSIPEARSQIDMNDTTAYNLVFEAGTCAVFDLRTQVEAGPPK